MYSYSLFYIKDLSRVIAKDSIELLSNKATESSQIIAPNVFSNFNVYR